MLARLVLGCLLLIISFPARGSELISQPAFDLIVRWEVGGPKAYVRKYSGIICPGNDLSGPTFGIGYDAGHNTAAQIRADWRDSPYVEHLAAMAGITGYAKCKALAAKRQFIEIPFELALRVFKDPSLVRYYRITMRSFPGMQALPMDTQGVLVSLVYNRGGNMVGERRREMRHIRDVCIPRRDSFCVAEQFRAMVRLWKGSVIEAGMRARRYDEAALAEKAR